MIACKPQKFPVSLWIVTLTEPGDTKPKKQNWDRLKIFKEMNGLRIIHSCIPTGLPTYNAYTYASPERLSV